MLAARGKSTGSSSNTTAVASGRCDVFLPVVAAGRSTIAAVTAEHWTKPRQYSERQKKTDRIWVGGSRRVIEIRNW